MGLHRAVTPGKRGRPHNDRGFRKVLQDFERVFGAENPYRAGWLDEYRNAWHLLRLEAWRRVSAEPSMTGPLPSEAINALHKKVPRSGSVVVDRVAALIPL
jgi:hypothetical protein